MDPSFCIAKRTRARTAMDSGTVSGRKKRMEDDTMKSGECSGKKRKGPAGGRGRVGASTELGCGGRKQGEDASSDGESVIFIGGDSDEDEVECVGEDGGEEGASDYVSSENYGEMRGTGSESRFEEGSNVVRIDMEDSEEDEEGTMDGGGNGEGVSVGFGLEDSVLKGIGSKLGSEKGKNPIHVNDIGLSGQQTGENDLKLNDGKSDCIARRTRSKIGFRKRPLSSTVCIDTDESQSSSENSEDNEDSDDEDFRRNKSHIKESSSSSEDEDREDTDDTQLTKCRNVGTQIKNSGFQNGLPSNTVCIDSDESQPSSDDNGNNDDSAEITIGMGKFHIEESSSYSGDEDGEGSETTKVARGRNVIGAGRDGSVETQLKRKRFSGLEILVASNTNKDDKTTTNTVRWNSCVAQRTRSHLGSGSDKAKKMLGTFSPPICCDVEVLGSSFGHDEDEITSSDGSISDYDNEEDANNGNDDNRNSCASVKNEVGGKKEEEVGKSTKRKRVHAPKADQFFTVLVNSIWEKGEAFLENLTSKDEAPKQEIDQTLVETMLPLKFSFGVEKSKPEEKSDYEKELDKLWAEFDFALKSSEIGSFGSSVVDNEESNVPEFEIVPATLCHQGKHQLILDENIGFRCRFCSFVNLEIKYVLPSWGTQPSGRFGRKISLGEADASMLDELHFQDAGGDSQDSRVHSKGTVWDIIPGIRNNMYQHQREGFEFMWKNLAGGIDLESLNKSTSSDGLGGCVISHAPGTGKTLLTIVFLKTYMEIYPNSRPLIIAPCSMLLTWEEEFKKWKVDIPFHNLNKSEFSGKENWTALNLVKRYAYRSKNLTRILKLYSWNLERSILGISYSLFGKLAGERFLTDKEGKKRRNFLLDKESKQIRKILLELPGLLVLDEGHTPRNERSHIWKALSKIETERRIILSGTPFQNNFVELFNTLYLVRPKFANKIQSVSEKKKARKEWKSLTSSIGKYTDDGLEEVRAMLHPFVHVHRGSILKENLPGLRDCVVVLHPPPLQKSILQSIQEIPNPLEFEFMLALTSVHPYLIMSSGCYRDTEYIIDKDALERSRLKPNEGVKTRFLMELFRLSEAKNEKVLVFSQFIEPILFIKDQLKSIFNLTGGEEVLQMDGKLSAKQRQSLINLFNDPASKARIMLASTKSCSEGINLIGASRVVLLDVVWNPSVERQAISRAYRLGQKKVVYTYHLITSGTMEGEKYYRQAKKDHLSELVFSSKHVYGDKINSSWTVSDDTILEEMVQHDKLKDMFEKIIYQPKESNSFGDWFSGSQTNTLQKFC